MVLFLDLAILAVLAFFAWRGLAKGFILTLCSLLAVLVAFMGASWVSTQFSQPVADLIQPYIQSHTETLLDNALEKVEEEITQPLRPGIPIPSAQPEGGEAPVEEYQASLDDVLSVLSESKFFSSLLHSVTQAIEDGSLTILTTAAAAVAAFLAQQLARIGLFLLSFLLILVVWWLVSHILDLAFRLPVLRTLNGTGGLILGIVKGLVILTVACWALVTFNVVPEEMALETHLFSLFLNFHLI